MRALAPTALSVAGAVFYEELLAKGVEFTQEPVEYSYGTDCALRDPFGNHIRIVQPAANPSPPEAAEFVES